MSEEIKTLDDFFRKADEARKKMEEIKRFDEKAYAFFQREELLEKAKAFLIKEGKYEFSPSSLEGCTLSPGTGPGWFSLYYVECARMSASEWKERQFGPRTRGFEVFYDSDELERVRYHTHDNSHWIPMSVLRS
ncbi:MAG: hypothetical protein HGA33_00740 [Candidatus Moranbacteria bacterium]|nr:hypothetical protein [Candidatus Moranbacteria bacterium]